MSKIAVLSKEISELIAAGEVIERPASVVKEVVENAIDAEAKHITVEIKHGGTTYMRVADDGSGIASEDVPTAFFRHATSKIHDRKDLESIYTLGFRGEALASIAAVSKVTLLTKRREDDYGTHYEIIGGTPTGEPEQGGCPDGTTIIIRDLFFNVPVRQRFMKKDVTEANAISQIVQKIALSHPEISFQMIRDNRMEFCTDGNGDFMLIYPEQSMWWNYRKPKPLKKGAYTFAAKNQVPVLPCFITMEDSDILGDDGFYVQEYTIHIAEPIYPDPQKSQAENVDAMRRKNAAVWKQIYEDFYGISLVYDTKEAVQYKQKPTHIA